MKIKYIVSAFVISALAACGGGGGDSDGPHTPPPNKLEGLFSSATPAGPVAVLIEPDGKIWAIDGTSTAAFLTGQVDEDDGRNFSAKARSLAIGQNVTLHGTYNPKKTVSATLWAQHPVVHYELAYNSRYDDAVNVQPGMYIGTDLMSNTPVQININGNTFSGYNVNCALNGTITPTGKGYNKITMTQAASSYCRHPGSTASGVLFEGTTEYVIFVSMGDSIGAMILSK